MKAETIAGALRGRKAGVGWMARCPAHDDSEPSLSIRHAADDKLLVHCHAGCEQERVIAALRSRGLWDQNGHRPFTRPAPRVSANERKDRGDAKRSEAALAIWQSATAADSTLVQTYLVSRGLHLLPPKTLRIHAGLKHPSGGIWPAMVALVTRGVDDTPIAIHRTFLARNGAGKAPVDPQKMTRTEWTGTASDLLGALAEVAGERVAKSKTWPDSPRALAGRLRRAATFLRKIGIEISFGREGRARTRTILIATTRSYAAPENTGAQPSASSAPSASPPKFNVVNGFANSRLRTVANDADGLEGASIVRANPVKTIGVTAADGAAANLPSQSALEKTETPGWKARI